MKKTKVLCISQKGNDELKIYVDGQEVEQVSQFRYLSSLISEDGYCIKYIQRRMEMAKKLLVEKKKLFTGKMNLELKKRIMKCFVCSVAQYAAEMWMLTQTYRRRSELQKPLKCGYGEEWKGSTGLIKLLMRKLSGE